MIAPIACPSPAELQVLADGHASAEVAESILAHVEHCSNCAALLDTLIAKDAVAQALQAGIGREYPCIDARVQRDGVVGTVAMPSRAWRQHAKCRIIWGCGHRKL